MTEGLFNLLFLISICLLACGYLKAAEIPTTTQGSVSKQITKRANTSTLCNDSLHHEQNVSEHDQHKEEAHGIRVFSFNWNYVKQPFILVSFVLVAGLLKIGFHYADFLSSIVPESCLLIILGVITGIIIHSTNAIDTFPLQFDPRVFFLFLLPPIMLESAYSLHDRAFADNLGTILIYAVIGTCINTFTIGPTLYWLASIGAMGEINIQLLVCLAFSALISAVDPVAVLAIFQEVGVNNDLYFLVFGESLLNDAVTVVLYNMMVNFVKLENVEIDQIGLGMASFMSVSLGGLFIGIILGLLTAIITKYTFQVRVVEPLAVFGIAYLSYLTAEMFHFSGIISIIACGLLQAQYSYANISFKSYTTVKYFSKMASSTSDSIIFMFLGLVLVNDTHVFHVGFVCWTIFLCLIYRTVSVFLLTFLCNYMERVRPINLEEQFIMCYGGLRGAVAFSLVIMLKEDDIGVHIRRILVTTTLSVIIFTVFLQGITIKPLVKLLQIKARQETHLSLSAEINSSVVDHIMAGIEEITGHHGGHYWREILDYYDDKYFKRWFQRDPRPKEGHIMEIYNKIALKQHFALLRKEEPQTGQVPTLARLLALQADRAGSAFLPSPPMFLLPDVDRDSPILFGDGRTSPKRKKVVFDEPSRDTLQKIFRTNPYHRLHKKQNRNLINDDEQDLEFHLRNRDLRARRASIASATSRFDGFSFSVEDNQSRESEHSFRSFRPRAMSAAGSPTLNVLESKSENSKPKLQKSYTVDVKMEENTSKSKFSSSTSAGIESIPEEEALTSASISAEAGKNGSDESQPFIDSKSKGKKRSIQKAFSFDVDRDRDNIGEANV